MRHTLWILAVICLPLPAIAQDAEAGRKVFRKCMACHATEADAPARAGPHLQGVVGRVTGSLDDYGYSAAMRTAGEEGHVWTPEEIARFVENPREVIAGTKMSFAGIRQEQERADLLAYLETLQ